MTNKKLEDQKSTPAEFQNTDLLGIDDGNKADNEEMEDQTKFFDVPSGIHEISVFDYDTQEKTNQNVVPYYLINNAPEKTEEQPENFNGYEDNRS